jgi:hypothetical protein
MDRLGDDQTEVVRQTVCKPLAPMRDGINMPECRLHPDLAVAQLDRGDRRVVRPQVERAAAFKVEAGVVPVTGQDAVLDAAAIEREAHMRAPIVEGEDAIAVPDDENLTVTAAHDEPTLRLQLRQASRRREFFVPRAHAHAHASCALLNWCRRRG